MSTSRLVNLLGATLRRHRELHQLSQEALADRAGVSQATVARIERGDRSPSLVMVERLLASMNAQLTVAVEPLDAQLDAELAALAGQSVVERIDDLDLDRRLDRLGDLPYVLTGCTAAMLQGAPVPVEGLEIAVSWDDSARFTTWLTAAYGQRWNARWQEYGNLRLEPEEPGEHRWRTIIGVLHATMCDELPQSIEVRHGGRSYPVVPLAQLEVTDPHTADLLGRHRQRQIGDDPAGGAGSAG